MECKNTISWRNAFVPLRSGVHLDQKAGQRGGKFKHGGSKQDLIVVEAPTRDVRDCDEDEDLSATDGRGNDEDDGSVALERGLDGNDIKTGNDGHEDDLDAGEVDAMRLREIGYELHLGAGAGGRARAGEGASIEFAAFIGGSGSCHGRSCFGLGSHGHRHGMIRCHTHRMIHCHGHRMVRCRSLGGVFRHIMCSSGHGGLRSSGGGGGVSLAVHIGPDLGIVDRSGGVAVVITAVANLVEAWLGVDLQARECLEWQGRV